MKPMKYPAIDAECARHGLSNAAMCEKIGVERRTMYSWRSGETEMPCSVLVKLVALFGVSADYLLGLSAELRKE